MHDTLHWLSYPQRVTFKLCLLTYKRLHGLAPDYLMCFCTLLTSVPGRLLLQLMQTNCWSRGLVWLAFGGVPSGFLARLLE